MANVIKIKAGSGVPTTSNIVDRELAFNRSNNKLYINDSGTIVDLSGTGGGGSAEEADRVVFNAQAGEALSKGDVIYISGISGNTPIVSKADADDSAKMPAFGLASSSASINTSVEIVTFGTLENFDTSAFSVGDTVFVSTTAGVLTATKPTGESGLIQNIGHIVRSHASIGAIKIAGSGRTAATPNLNQDKIFLGNASNQSVSTALSSIGLSKFSNDLGFGGGANRLITDDGDGTVTTESELTYSGGLLDISGSLYSIIRLNETDVTNNPAWWTVADGGSYSIRLNNTGTYPLSIVTNASNDAVDSITLGYNTSVLGNLTTTAHLQLPYGEINDAGTDMNIVSTNALTLGTESGTALTIPNASTNVGIGTVSPGEKLEVSGNIKISSSSNYLQASNIQNLISGGTFRIKNFSGSSLAEFQNDGDVYIPGNVGIGTNSPESPLHISNSTDELLKLTSTGANSEIRFSPNTSAFDVRIGATASSANSEFYVETAGTKRLYVDNSGNVGIGTTSPSQKLQVAGHTRISGVGNGLYFDTTGSTESNVIATINDYETLIATNRGSAGFGVIGNSDIRFGFGTSYNTAQTKLYINGSSGNVGIGTTSPSQKLDIQDGQLTFTQSALNQAVSGRIRFNEYSSDSSVSGAYIQYNGASNYLQMFTNSETTDYEFLRALRGSHLSLQPSGGNVGIGTTHPASPLEVNGNVAFGDTATGIKGTIHSTDEYRINGLDVDEGGWNSLHLRADGTDGLFIQKDTNNVGIGNQSPAYKLDVNGTARFQGSVRFPDSVGATFGDSGDLQIFHNGSYGNITNGTGNLYIDNTTDNGDMYFRVDDAGTLFTAMRIDGSEIGNVHLPNDGQNLYIGQNNDIRLVHLSGTNYMYTYNGPFYLGAVSTDQDVFIRGNDGGTSINAVQFDMSDAGTAIFNHDIWLKDDLSAIRFGAGKDGSIYSYQDDLYIANQTAGQDTIFRNLKSDSSAYVDNLFIDGSAERVGIGTTSPSSKLHVYTGTDISMDASGNGQVRVEGNGYALGIALNASGAFIYQNSSARFMAFGNNETEQVRLTTGGALHVVNDVVAFSSTPSDQKLKTNVKDIEYGLDTIMKLNPKQYDWKEDNRHDIGFIAQEVEEVIPEIVKDNEWFDDKIKTLDYEKLTAVLIKAVQEQQQQINKLEEKLNG